jgi:hypothetical protein
LTERAQQVLDIAKAAVYGRYENEFFKLKEDIEFTPDSQAASVGCVPSFRT